MLFTDRHTLARWRFSRDYNIPQIKIHKSWIVLNTNQVQMINKFMTLKYQRTLKFETCSGNVKWSETSDDARAPWWSSHGTTHPDSHRRTAPTPWWPPGGRVHDQVKLAAISCMSLPEKYEPQARLSILILNKTYPSGDNYITNTLDMQGFWLVGLFAKKRLSLSLSSGSTYTY